MLAIKLSRLGRLECSVLSRVAREHDIWAKSYRKCWDELLVSRQESVPDSESHRTRWRNIEGTVRWLGWSTGILTQGVSGSGAGPWGLLQTCKVAVLSCPRARAV